MEEGGKRSRRGDRPEGSRPRPAAVALVAVVFVSAGAAGYALSDRRHLAGNEGRPPPPLPPHVATAARDHRPNVRLPSPRFERTPGELPAVQLVPGNPGYDSVKLVRVMESADL